MVFIQADPFEREFSQSQQSGGGGGGGGGGGNQSAQISQREKEIISATFRQQGDKIRLSSRRPIFRSCCRSRRPRCEIRL